MAYDLEEQEKLDALRAWWDRYGTLSSALVFIVVAAVVGWRGWQWYQGHEAAQAMSYFEALENATGQQGADALARIKAASETLRKDYPRSGYTSRAALVAADALQDRNATADARAQLEWLIKNSSDQALVPLARLRLAGLLLDEKQYDAALAQLRDAPAPYAGLYADRRGDILAAQGKTAEAKAAWAEAVKALAGQSVVQVIQLKIDALGGA